MRTITKCLSILCVILFLTAFMKQKSKPFAFPIQAKFHPKILATYGVKKNTVLNIAKRHTGIDITADKQATILSAQKGTVLEVYKSDSKYGNFIMIEHNNTIKTFYGNLKSIRVVKDQIVHIGQKIGTIGNSGPSLKTQLHFEVLKNDKNVNPLEYITLKK